MRIAICDDEEHIRKEIGKVIGQLPYLSHEAEVEEFSSGEQLLHWYDTPGKANLLMIDIEMGRIDGIKVAKKIRSIDSDIIIIFITSHSEQVLETFDCETFYFLPKPYSKERLRVVLRKAYNKFKNKQAFLDIMWKTEVNRVPICDIKYIERTGRHLVVYTNGRKYDMNGTLSETLSRLEEYGFLQVHQGFLVNMNYILRFAPQDVILFDGTTVMMSVRRRSECIEKFISYYKRTR